MASIQRRGDKSFLLTVIIGYDSKGRRLRRTKTIKVEDKALLKTKKRLNDYLNEELLKFKIEVEAGEYIAPDKMLFENFVQEWREKHGEKNLSPTTLKVYNHHLKNHILPAFGEKQISQIKTIQIINFLDRLSRPGARKDKQDDALSPGTIGYMHKILKSIFGKALEWRLIKTNPMDGVKKPKNPQKEMLFFDSDEAAHLIELLNQEPIMWKMCFLTALIGGLRRGELVALEVSDIDFDENTLSVTKNIPLTVNGEALVRPTKSSKPRTIKMPFWYMEELKEYLNQWQEEKEATGDMWKGGEHEYLFHAGFGEPLYYNSPTQKWLQFIKKHDIKRIRLHDLRHTMVTLLIEAGANIKAIQKRAGHSSFRITADTYGHVTKKIIEDTVQHFDKFAPK